MYLDEIWFTNLVMNYLLLKITAGISRRETKGARLFAGASLGASYLLLMFIPAQGFFITLLAKLCLSVAIIYVTFSPGKGREFFPLLGLFYLVSFAVGGATLACAYFLAAPAYSSGGAVLLSPVEGWKLTLPLLLVLVMGRGGLAFLEQKKWQRLGQVELVISLGGKEGAVTGLFDTGNRLKEPVSRDPVVVVEIPALGEVLPEVLGEDGGDAPAGLDTCRLLDTPLATRLCYIPYTSLGKARGYLLGIRPEALRLREKGREIEVERKVVIGLYPGQLSRQGDYQALLPPDLLDNTY